MDNHQVDVAIVGAGAAGLAAGIFAAEFCRTDSGRERFRVPQPRIVILDGAKSVGAKILISGGGRCNVTNQCVSHQDFNGLSRVVRNILAAFDEQATCRWFASLGVELKCEESGKLFPTTNQARTVLTALTSHCRELGVEILTEHRVTNIVGSSTVCKAPDSAQHFIIHHARGEMRARRVVMATGGQSLPRTGSDGIGWQLVRRLGHTVTSTHPALVPLVLRAIMFHAELSGLSQDVQLTTLIDGKPVDRRTGSMLWTHFGVSGPVVMDSSRFWTIGRAAGGLAELRCHFWPGMDFNQVDRWFLAQAHDRPRLSTSHLLALAIPDRLAGALCRWCRIDPATPAGQLRHESRRKLVHAVTDFPLPVERDRGWNYAEVTAGGVPLDEIDFRTMQSRKVPGLYLIGEMLDCDGRIGGFNFQWAWATGYVGGRAVAAGLGLRGRSELIQQ
ncbi:MAG TPA: NAD(P)/FAD-dependent oxidoreductase [Nitrospiraceae bacterium]|nr:NAD(P)/FAD-dependent oxidoreductase [Nitrospiraceae bacterium]